jgi:glucose-6-phosphate isomerase
MTNTSDLIHLSFDRAVAEGMPAAVRGSVPVTRDDVLDRGVALEAAAAELARLEAGGTVGFLALDRVGWGLDRAVEVASRLRAVTDTLLVLGIGGSALGAMALDSALGPACSDPHQLVVLDTVDPFAVVQALANLDPGRTAVAVISKSGGTVETAALFRVVLPWLREGAGAVWSERMVVVTDKVHGALRPLADAYGLDALVVPDDVGGRFSVLTAVGILPAAYRGLDVAGLLSGAEVMAARVRAPGVVSNPAWAFAAVHDAWWGPARTSVLLTYSERLSLFGDWYMQLWAESLAKPLPGGGEYGWMPGAARGPADQHSQLQLWQQGPADRLMTVVRVQDHGADLTIAALDGPEDAVASYLAGTTMSDLLEAERRGTTTALVEAGRPVLELSVPCVDAEVIGGLVILFETATALAGLMRGIDPFDQPGVETGKQFAYGLLGRPGFAERARRVAEVLDAE